MKLKEWAEANKLRWRLDGCRDPIVPGRFGHIYEHSDTQLGAFLEYPVSSRLGIRAMRSKQRRIDALGCTVKQKADGEGSWLLPLDFDSKHPYFAQLLKILRIRKIRKATGKPFQKQVRP